MVGQVGMLLAKIGGPLLTSYLLDKPTGEEKELRQLRRQLMAMGQGETTSFQRDYLRQLRERYGRIGNRQAGQVAKSFARRGIGRSPASAAAVSQIRAQAAGQGEDAVSSQRMAWQQQAIGVLPSIYSQLAQMKGVRGEKLQRLNKGLLELLSEDEDRFREIFGQIGGLFGNNPTLTDIYDMNQQDLFVGG